MKTEIIIYDIPSVKILQYKNITGIKKIVLVLQREIHEILIGQDLQYQKIVLVNIEKSEWVGNVGTRSFVDIKTWHRKE